MSSIELPPTPTATADSVASFLEALKKWKQEHPLESNRQGYHSGVWARGYAWTTFQLTPGVYRAPFTKRAETMYGDGLEEKRLNLEREMLSAFRTAGATSATCYCYFPSF